MQGHEIVLRTGRIHEFELVCNALNEANIPYVKQEESVSGLKTGYVQPVMGPGNYFNLLVPTESKQKALDIISALPVDLGRDPDVWHYGGTEKAKKKWRVYITVVLGIVLVLTILNVIKIIK